MQIQVSGHQIEITPALRDYVDARRERLARRFDHVTSLNVVLEVEKNRLVNRAEGTLTTAGTVLHANAVDGDMYAAIDALFDKLDAQVRKHKDKRRTHGREDIRNLAGSCDQARLLFSCAVVPDRCSAGTCDYDPVSMASDTRTAIHGPRSEAFRGQALTFHNSGFGRILPILAG
jgi:putative sigma-54 modulation protein